MLRKTDCRNRSKHKQTNSQQYQGYTFLLCIFCLKDFFRAGIEFFLQNIPNGQARAYTDQWPIRNITQS